MNKIGNFNVMFFNASASDNNEVWMTVSLAGGLINSNFYCSTNDTYMHFNKAAASVLRFYLQETFFNKGLDLCVDISREGVHITASVDSKNIVDILNEILTIVYDAGTISEEKFEDAKHMAIADYVRRYATRKGRTLLYLYDFTEKNRGWTFRSYAYDLEHISIREYLHYINHIVRPLCSNVCFYGSIKEINFHNIDRILKNFSEKKDRDIWVYEEVLTNRENGYIRDDFCEKSSAVNIYYDGKTSPYDKLLLAECINYIGYRGEGNVLIRRTGASIISSRYLDEKLIERISDKWDDERIESCLEYIRSEFANLFIQRRYFGDYIGERAFEGIDMSIYSEMINSLSPKDVRTIYSNGNIHITEGRIEEVE